MKKKIAVLLAVITVSTALPIIAQAHGGHRAVYTNNGVCANNGVCVNNGVCDRVCSECGGSLSYGICTACGTDNKLYKNQYSNGGQGIYRGHGMGHCQGR